MARTRREFTGAAAWVAVEGVGGAAFSVFGLLMIAALIGPTDLGLSAIALGVMQLVNFFPDTLFYDAIIQRRRLSRSHLGSAFWSVVALSLCLTAGVAVLAPLAGRLYNAPELSPLLRVLSLSCVPTAIASIQSARLRRAMKFRVLALYAVISRALATAAGISLAISGYGPWAIVAQTALVPAILVLLYGTVSRWRFVEWFSFSHAGEISVFAVTRTAGHLIDVSRGRLFFIVLGYYLPLREIGQINLAFRLLDSLTAVMTSGIARLCLPAFSRMQYNLTAVATAAYKMSSTLSAVLVPPFIALVFLGDDVVHVFAGASWRGMGDLVPWFSLAGLVVIIEIAWITALVAVGRPLMVSVINCISLAALLIALLVVKPTTASQAGMCWLASLLAGLPASISVTRSVLGLGIRAQASCLVPAVLISAGIAGVAIAGRWILGSDLTPLRVAAQFGIVGIAYLLLEAVFFGFPFRPRKFSFAYVGRIP